MENPLPHFHVRLAALQTVAAIEVSIIAYAGQNELTVSSKSCASLLAVPDRRGVACMKLFLLIPKAFALVS